AGIGRLLLLMAGVGMVVGGGTIMMVGMTRGFVPQDLAFMQVMPSDLATVNPRLIALIPHDPAGFGGGVCSCGLLVCLCASCAPPSRSLWQALGLAGAAGFGTAIGVHFVIGYYDFVHLVPAYTGCVVYVTGLVMAVLGHGARTVQGTAFSG